ncbi:hypothetical protein HDV02_003895 [Globomyces sp. JEL0801]|nr:hypothetical protein HDV02_003895 [Globomyces sp. JEL0801]
MIDSEVKHLAEPIIEGPKQIKGIQDLKGGLAPPTFLEILTTLKWIENDDRIEGIYADFSTGSNIPELDFAQMQELRDSIKSINRAKEARFGKGSFKSVAFTDTFTSQNQYYLATSFNTIQMEEFGFINLEGFSMFQPLGINVQETHAGKFKGGSSTFTSRTWPDAVRKNMIDVYQGLNSQLISDITADRLQSNKKGGKEVSVKDIMNMSPIYAKESLLFNLVSKLAYKRPFVPIDKKSKIDSHPVMSLKAYRKAKSNELMLNLDPSVPTIGIVYLIGNIFRGDGQYGSNTVVRALLAAANDENVKAIVFRVDSSGGDGMASDSIREAIEYIIRDLKKPVIASYGNISASGGVLSSVSASKIYASRGSITGSIGVFTVKPNVQKDSFAKLGIDIEEVHFSEGSKNASYFEAKTENDKVRTQAYVDNVYGEFKDKVSKGRKGLVEDMESVAQGQVWTGEQALERKLIDELGGFNDAINDAMRLAYPNTNKANPYLATFPKKESIFAQMMGGGSSQVQASFFVNSFNHVISQWFANLTSQTNKINLTQEQQFKLK